MPRYRTPKPSDGAWRQKRSQSCRNQGRYTVRATSDPELVKSVINDLQCFESTLAVYFPLWSIDWRYATMSVVFEEGDERDPTWGSLKKLRISRPQLQPERIPENVFEFASLQAFSSESLVIVQSFWREGRNEVRAGRFINAFFNYYFILEGLYGDGKTRNDAIKAKFKGSVELRSFIGQYLRDKHEESHIEQVGAMLLTANPNLEFRFETIASPDVFIELLVSTRGKLHHFSNNPNRPEGSPLGHDQYEGIAIFAQYVAHKALLAAARKLRDQALPKHRSDDFGGGVK